MAGSLALAVALLLMAVGCLWLAVRPAMAPKTPKVGEREGLNHWLWKNARGLYVFFDKVFLLFGFAACLAGAGYFVWLSGQGR